MNVERYANKQGLVEQAVPGFSLSAIIYVAMSERQLLEKATVGFNPAHGNSPNGPKAQASVHNR